MVFGFGFYLDAILIGAIFCSDIFPCLTCLNFHEDPANPENIPHYIYKKDILEDFSEVSETEEPSESEDNKQTSRVKDIFLQSSLEFYKDLITKSKNIHKVHKEHLCNMID